MATPKRLRRGIDWHGWVWYYDNDPDYGTGLDDEVYAERVTWSDGYERRHGRWVRVKFVPVDSVTPRSRAKR